MNDGLTLNVIFTYMEDEMIMCFCAMATYVKFIGGRNLWHLHAKLYRLTLWPSWARSEFILANCKAWSLRACKDGPPKCSAWSSIMEGPIYGPRRTIDGFLYLFSKQTGYRRRVPCSVESGNHVAHGQDPDPVWLDPLTLK